MFLERYPFEVSPDHCEYEFFSSGPNGKIKKLVLFEPMEIFFGERIYNLSLCDWNEYTMSRNFDVISDNKDTEMVLLTISAIVMDFVERFPRSVIWATGSTAARTRRYQMSLNKYYSQIQPFFNIQGMLSGGEIQPFTKGANYTGFLAKKW